MDTDLKEQVNDRRMDKGYLYTRENVEDEKTLRKIKNKRFTNAYFNRVFRENIEKYIKNDNNIEPTELNILKTLINVYQPEDNKMTESLTASQRDAANHADAQNTSLTQNASIASLGGKSKTRKNKSKKSKTKRTKKSKTKRSKK
jgi:hypothetical protein